MLTNVSSFFLLALIRFDLDVAFRLCVQTSQLSRKLDDAMMVALLMCLKNMLDGLWTIVLVP